jgi:hypothetical protein
LHFVKIRNNHANMSLLSFMGWLDEDSDEVNIGEAPSILECIKPDGGLDIGRFLHRQEVISLLELSMLKQTGLIGNSGSPTGSLTSNMP